ncbi:hypothetical protein [Asaia astilbis]
MFYEDAFPYYVELCALSELRKKPGFGIPIRSGMGGHLIFYLNGVKIRRDRGYPLLEVCPEDADPARKGAAISVNSHFVNANWVPVERNSFVLSGLVKPGQRLDRAAYAETQEHARQQGIFDGIDLHTRYYRDKPAGMSNEAFKYEISIGTDYAVRFGRDTYRAKLPVDREEMTKIVSFLNDLNAPFRDGHKTYSWNLINNNCVHVAHNALSAAGIWKPWPTGLHPGLAVFHFPVPKNAFIDLALRANDLKLENPRAIYADLSARCSLLRDGTLPVRAGALCTLEPALEHNDLYDTKALKLIFYDNPFWGAYLFRLRRISRDPRYLDLLTNLDWFKHRYQSAREKLAGEKGLSDCFEGAYERHIDFNLARLARIMDQSV